MTEHLVFTLAAGMASMGELAGHERRGTLSWPGRSAVLGLCAAALGIRRDGTAGLERLEALKVAVGVLADGAPLRDYHTVQTIPTAAAKRPDSRPQALRTAGRNVNTTITYRDYRVGVLYAVALWGAPLEELEQALRQPVFTLYLGRKSCPLSAPPDPRFVGAENALEALRHASCPPFHRNADIRLVASDAPLSSGDMVDLRHDIATDREKWHFTARRVHVHRPGPASEVLP